MNGRAILDEIITRGGHLREVAATAELRAIGLLRGRPRKPRVADVLEIVRRVATEMRDAGEPVQEALRRLRCTVADRCYDKPRARLAVNKAVREVYGCPKPRRRRQPKPKKKTVTLRRARACHYGADGFATTTV